MLGTYSGNVEIDVSSLHPLNEGCFLIVPHSLSGTWVFGTARIFDNIYTAYAMPTITLKESVLSITAPYIYTYGNPGTNNNYTAHTYLEYDVYYVGKISSL